MSARILVNDDEAGTIHALKRLLERKGYTAIATRALEAYAWSGKATCAAATRGDDLLALGAERGCRRGVLFMDRLTFNLDTMVHPA